MLFSLDRQRSTELAAASRELAQGRPDVAFFRARRAEEIRRGSDSAQLLTVAALLRRDFSAAWRAYQRTRIVSGG